MATQVVESDIPGERIYPIDVGQGMYSADLATNIPDGFSAVCYNMVATGESLENRIGIKRTSVDWKVGEINPAAVGSISDDFNYFCHIAPWGRDSSKPAFMWGSRGYSIPGLSLNSNTLQLVRAAGAAGSGDGFMSVVIASGQLIGIAQYQDVIYLSIAGDGIHKITAINWSADTVTYSAIASAATGTVKGLFTFKDRLWGWNGNKLYYTDVPSVGSQPETWAFASNVVPIVGPNGAGEIKKVVPLANKLAIFTTNGLFTLLVEGAPASWIFRVLDSKSISTASQCAFETKGAIYYVNTQGVWVTDTRSVTKMSAVIDDQWFLAKGNRIHTIAPYEDGMVVSVAKVTTDDRYFDRDNCRTFYSKVDPVAWTEWNFNSYGVGGNYSSRLAYVWSTTDKIPTYLNAEPSVYLLALVTDSTPSTVHYGVMQLLTFDAGVDQYVNVANTVESAPVGIYLKTKHFDGGNQFLLKRAHRGLMEIYTSDAEHEFTTSWDNDATTQESEEIVETSINDFVVGLGSNLVQLKGLFWFRRASLNVRAELQTDNSQIKIKYLAVAIALGRGEFELIR